MRVEIIGEITNKSVIATGRGVRELARLRKVYGAGRWRKLKGVATVRLIDGRIAKAEFTGMKRMASAKRNSRSNGFSTRARVRPKSEPRFVVCIQNKDFEASLQVRRIYRAIADARAERHQYLRVVDESGESYLYPQNFFVSIELPKAAEKAFLLAS